jgi:hypothetical protein
MYGKSGFPDFPSGHRQPLGSAGGVSAGPEREGPELTQP